MAIDINNTRFLLHQKNKGQYFGKVGIIGKQGLYVPTKIIPKLFQNYHLTFNPAEKEFYESFFQSNSEIIFHNLGITDFEYIDISGYEGATVLHDMNIPIPKELENKYDTLIDIGSLEHMFNISTALENYMKLIKRGGCLFLLNMPINNCCGHGFYQFSPELFFMLFKAENGFLANDIFIAEDKPFADFYRVVPTNIVKQRTQLINYTPTLMYGSFTKLSDNAKINEYPIQYNYKVSWNKNPKTTNQSGNNPTGFLRQLMISISSRWYFSYSINRSIKRLRKEQSTSNVRFFEQVKEIY